MIQKLIDIEEENKENSTITMSYINYLKKLKRVCEIGNCDMG